MSQNNYIAYGGDTIGGSCNGYFDSQVLVDFGGIQEEGKPIRLPNVPLEVLQAAKVFIVGHAHIDHCFGAAVFAKINSDAVILMTRITRDSVKLQLMSSVDLARKQQKIAELEGHPVPPLLFDEADVENLIKRVRCVDDTAWFDLFELPEYKFSFQGAGHLSGAAIIVIEIPDGELVVHACDYSVGNQPLVKGAESLLDFLKKTGKPVRSITTECTYGNRELPNRAKEEEKLIALVKDTLAKNGNVLVISYSTAAPGIAAILAQAEIDVWLDGMGRDFYRIFRRAKSWSGNEIPISNKVREHLFCVEGADQHDDHRVRKELIRSGRPFCVVTPNGRLEGGPAVGYLEAFAEDKRNLVVIVGYQGGPGSRGNQLIRLEAGKPLTFVSKFKRGRTVVDQKVTVRVYSRVAKLQISGHSDSNAMADWISKINPKMVLTTHGDLAAHAGLAMRINERDTNIIVESGINGKEITF